MGNPPESKMSVQQTGKFLTLKSIGLQKGYNDFADDV